MSSLPTEPAGRIAVKGACGEGSRPIARTWKPGVIPDANLCAIATIAGCLVHVVLRVDVFRVLSPRPS